MRLMLLCASCEKSRGRGERSRAPPFSVSCVSKAERGVFVMQALEKMRNRCVDKTAQREREGGLPIRRRLLLAEMKLALDRVGRHLHVIAHSLKSSAFHF